MIENRASINIFFFIFSYSLMDTYSDIYEPVNRKRIFLLMALMMVSVFYYSTRAFDASSGVKADYISVESIDTDCDTFECLYAQLADGEGE